ncbi:MAG: hypothetical protein QXW98_06480 [Candidatus Caldarchaeum sp.]
MDLDNHTHGLYDDETPSNPELRPPLFHLLEPTDILQKKGAAKVIAVLEGYKPEEIAQHLPLYVPQEFFTLVNIHYVPELVVPERLEEIRKYMANYWYHLKQIAHHRQPFLVVINPYRSLFKEGVREMWNSYMGENYPFLTKQMVRLMNYRYVMPILIVNPAEPYVDVVVELHKVYQMEHSIPHIVPSVSPYKALSLASSALYDVYGALNSKKKKPHRKQR